MAGRVRVQIDQKAIDAYFRTDPIAQAGLLSVAKKYEEAAIEASPVGQSIGKFVTLKSGQIVGPFGRPYRHGLFKRSFHIRPFRGGYRVYNADRFAHLVEFGSTRNHPYSPMRRALLAMSAGRAVVHPSKVSTSAGAVEGEHTLR
jgi:hypothetical protein